jgi:ankyrin repeat protein
MTSLPTALIGEFIDAAVRDQERAAGLLAAHPDLINARWLHGETVLHFLAVEGFTEGVAFLAEHGADVNAVNVLHSAVRSANDRLVALLLAAGADARYRTDLGESVFDAVPASGAERESIPRTLADYGVIPD